MIAYWRGFRSSPNRGQIRRHFRLCVSLAIEATFYLEEEMVAMMILMVVLLVVGGPGGHMSSHGAHNSPNQPAQAHEHGDAKPDPDKR